MTKYTKKELVEMNNKLLKEANIKLKELLAKDELYSSSENEMRFLQLEIEAQININER